MSHYTGKKNLYISLKTSNWAVYIFQYTVTKLNNFKFNQHLNKPTLLCCITVFYIRIIFYHHIEDVFTVNLWLKVHPTSWQCSYQPTLFWLNLTQHFYSVSCDAHKMIMQFLPPYYNPAFVDRIQVLSFSLCHSWQRWLSSAAWKSHWSFHNNSNWTFSSQLLDLQMIFFFTTSLNLDPELNFFFVN